jgi:hypothetical protein
MMHDDDSYEFAAALLSPHEWRLEDLLWDEREARAAARVRIRAAERQLTRGCALAFPCAPPQLVGTLCDDDAAPSAAPALLLPAAPAPLPRGSVPATRRVRCQVPGCDALDGVPVRRFNARARVCDTHAAASAVQLEGGLSRLCVRCAAFHTLDAFDGSRRCCVASTDKRNERRRYVYARQSAAMLRAAAAAADSAAVDGAAPSSNTPSNSAMQTLLAGADGGSGGSGSDGSGSDVLNAAAECFLQGGGSDGDDAHLAQALGLTSDDDAAAAPAAVAPPASRQEGEYAPPWQPQYVPPWAPQPVSMKFVSATPLSLPRGLSDALQHALCGTGAALPQAPARVLLEGWVSPGCTLLRCDVAALRGGAETAPADAADAVARLLACAAGSHPAVASFLAAQAPWSLAWRGALAVMDADGGVSSAPRAPGAPPPLARLPPPWPLAAAVGTALTVPLASAAATHARPQCRFHGRVLAGVRHAATPPPNAPAALHIEALPPTPGCALLEYAPRDGEDAGPFPAPRPLVVCPSVAVADEINTLSPRRSDASEALLWALGAALRRDARCPLPLAALVTGVAVSRGWAATTAALLPSLRDAFDDAADADGDARARAVLDATLGRHDTLARRAARTRDARILAAVLAAGGPEAAFGAPSSHASAGDAEQQQGMGDDALGDEEHEPAAAHPAQPARASVAAPAPPPPHTLPPELQRQAFRCYAFMLLFMLISLRFVRATVASLALTPALVAAAMPHLPPHFAAGIYHGRLDVAYRLSLPVCAAGMLLTRVPRLAPLYARLHVALLVSLFAWQALLVPIMGALLAAREWGFGPDLASGQIGVPLWSSLRVHGWMVSFSAFGAATPLPPRVHAPLLLLRGMLPLAAHFPGGHNLCPRVNLAWCCAHAAVMTALALANWRLAARQAAAAAAAEQVAATRKRL